MEEELSPQRHETEPERPGAELESGAEEGPRVGFSTVLGAFLGGFFVTLLFLVGGSLLTGSLMTLSLLAEIGFLLGVIGFLVVRGHRLREALRLRPAPRGAYALAVKLGIALLLANFAATVFLGPSPRDLQFVGEAEGLAERLVLTALVVLAAPVVEETLFRGLIQGVLETRLRHWFAILLAALAFALMHAPGPAPLFFFLWSLPVGWITWRTGSIGPAIAVHGVNNLVGLIGLFASGPVDTTELSPGPATLLVAGVILIVAGVWVVGLSKRMGALVQASDGAAAQGLGRRSI